MILVIFIRPLLSLKWGIARNGFKHLNLGFFYVDIQNRYTNKTLFSRRFFYARSLLKLVFAASDMGFLTARLFPVPQLVFGLAIFGILQGKWHPDLGNPVISNIFSDSLEQNRYIWGAVETEPGMYLFGQDRVLTFDGQSWGGFGSANRQLTRGIEVDGRGNLWVASFNDIGYFPNGRWYTDGYVSVRTYLPDEYRGFGQAMKLAYHNGSIWLATYNDLFRWDGDGFTAWNFPSEHQVLFHFLEDEGIFFHLFGEGLYRFNENGPPRIYTEHSWIAKNSILYFERQRAGDYLGISMDGFFVLDREGQLLNHHRCGMLFEASPSSALRLQNGWLAVGTLRLGLIIFDSNFEPVHRFGEQEGAPSDLVIGLFEDADQGLWVFFSNELIRLEMARSVGQQKSGFHFSKGVIREVQLADSGYYYGLDTGLSYLPLNETSVADRYRILWNRSATSLLALGSGGVLSAHFYDLYRWKEGTLMDEVRLSREIRSVIVSRRFPERFYVLFSHGITHIDWLGDDGWGSSGREYPLPLTAEKGVEDERGRLWLSAPGSYLLEAEFDALGHLQNTLEHHDLAGIVPTEGTIVKVGWGDSLLVMMGNRASFRTESSWKPIAVAEEWKGLRVRFAASDPFDSKKAWVYLEDPEGEKQRIWKLVRDSNDRIYMEAFHHSGLSQLGSLGGFNISAQGDSTILHLWGAGGVLNLDTSVHEQALLPRNPRVTAWKVDSEPLDMISHEILIPFDYQEMSVMFSSPGFSGARPYYYQNRLNSSGWSAPAIRPARELGRLFEGKYSLDIRAIDANGKISGTSTLTFSILPTWYRTWWAYLSYLVMLSVGIWLIIHARESRLVKRKEELDAIVSQRTVELEKASRIKSDFIANMSHEIRNPLNGVIGLISRLKANQPIPERHRNALNRAAQYLQATVEEVLDFSRIESGRINFESVVFDPVDILQGVIEIYGERAAAKGLLLTFHSRNPSDFHVRSDPSKVQQIAGNLVGNAVKFTAKGSVHMGFSLEALSDDQGIMKFWVEDTGPGIAAEEQKLVFDKYYQSEAMDSNLRKRGTGLGLSLCRDFVENMGGAVRLRSIAGQGSTFSISLPVLLEQPTVGELSAKKNDGAVERKVLIVEDMEYNRLYLEDVLKDIGCQVVSCSDGETGLERALNEDWDLIFLDWDLPKITGLEIARRVRKSDTARSQTVIVGMTAFATVETRNACLDAGMDHFLTKPLPEDKITGVVFSVKPASAAKPPSAPSKNVAWMSYHALERLAEMKKVPIENEIARYLDIVDEISAEIEMAIAALDWEESGHRVHALLGHTGLITCAALTGVILDFQTVVHARDEAALEKEWQCVKVIIIELKQYMTNPSTQAMAAK